MRHQGKISSWKDDQGFGFITPNAGGTRVFVHIKAFQNRKRRPAVNEIVTYELVAKEKGRPCAVNVAFVGERTAPVAHPQGAVSLGLAIFFLVFVALLSFAGKLPFVVPALYLGGSLVAFVAYAFDKSAAKNGQWRTQESTLHMLALVGGWPGALAAQRLLRHKSKKQEFQLIFWITVLLNCGAFIWLFTAQGKSVLRALLGWTT
ncbi:MAG TPA: cold shock and DUF1294 domain-containing protein [Noviherbaspirillum sp.]|nr:cold shock and DUF1294 domain-containing protein [Noviherbaspirillum sp.]